MNQKINLLDNPYIVDYDKRDGVEVRKIDEDNILGTQMSSLLLTDMALAKAFESIYKLIEPNCSCVFPIQAEDFVKEMILLNIKTENLSKLPAISIKRLNVKHIVYPHGRSVGKNVYSDSKVGFYFVPVLIKYRLRYYGSSYALTSRFLENMYLNGSMASTKFEYQIPKTDQFLDGFWKAPMLDTYTIQETSYDEDKKKTKINYVDIELNIETSIISKPVSKEANQGVVRVIYQD